MDAASFLDARDARAALGTDLHERALARGSRSVVWITVNVPGPDKRPGGIDPVFRAAASEMAARLPDVELALDGADLLGPFAVLFTSAEPAAAKRSAMIIENAAPERRLIDIDVYDAAGIPVDRQQLGLPQRSCLVCPEPARDCIRLARHEPKALASAVASLLQPAAPEELARCLVSGARAELDLTPKPGLVDRRDNGSHPDLSYALMTRSIELLPAYFKELVALRRDGAVLGACIEAGRRAERRMLDALGANAHRGYIFLAGLLLVASCDAERANVPAFPGLRDRVRALAREFFGRDAGADPRAPTNGSRARREHGVDGIRAEALDGLPSIFDTGLPAFETALAVTADSTAASYALLGALMQRVDDTTAVHRCGPAGLKRLRRDGRALADLVASGADPARQIEAWNDEYRRIGLTMGGVADCMAVTFALHELGAVASPAEAI